MSAARGTTQEKPAFRMSRKLAELFLAHPFELVVGVIVGLVGIWLSDFPEQRVAANVLIALGGILVSVAATRSVVAHAAREDVANRLQVTAWHLGNVSSQINRTIASAQEGLENDRTALALIAQSMPTLYGLVSDIQRMTGVPFDPSSSLETAERANEMAREFDRLLRDMRAGEGEPREVEASPDRQANGQKDLATQLQELWIPLRSEIESLRSSLTQRQQPAKSQVHAPCPNCGADVELALGTAVGDSAAPTCAACGSKFFAHRSATGTVFTRVVSSTGPRQYSTVTKPCPHCGQEHEFVIGSWQGDSARPTCRRCNRPFHAHRLSDGSVITKPGSLGPGVQIQCPGCNNRILIRAVEGGVGVQIERYCTQCKSRLVIDVATQSVVSITTEPPLLGRKDGTGSSARVECPLCKQLLRPFSSRDGSLYAKCLRDQRYVEAPSEALASTVAPASGPNPSAGGQGTEGG